MKLLDLLILCHFHSHIELLFSSLCTIYDVLKLKFLLLCEFYCLIAYFRTETKAFHIVKVGQKLIAFYFRALCHCAVVYSRLVGEGGCTSL